MHSVIHHGATGSRVNNHSVTDIASRVPIQGFLMASSCKLGTFVVVPDPFPGAAFPLVVIIFSTTIALYLCFSLQGFLFNMGGCIIHAMRVHDRITLENIPC